MTKVKIFSILLIAGIFMYYQNYLIQVTNYYVDMENLPQSFDGYKIVHLSDLHGRVFYKNNSPLLSKIKKAKPDMIVVTGDLIDYSTYDMDNTISLMKEIKKDAPVYYVTGNHEVSSAAFPHLERELVKSGIHILRNSTDTIRRGGEEILLIGLDDPIVTNVSENWYCKKTFEKHINRLTSENGTTVFKILLSHRPEQLPTYAKFNIDLTFAGHTHGGQFGLPFIKGGLYAPNQGFFPKYSGGKYIEGKSHMILSRGLGNGSIPVRLFNRPELVVVTLHKK